MKPPKFPKEFLELLRSVTAKRPRIVIDHILRHGHVTTEELKTLYGYDHPPRAARDVREQGIPLETVKVRDSRGRLIGAYRFGDPTTVRSDVLSGRKAIPKAFKEGLLERYGGQCGVCGPVIEPRTLQVDHRIPYAVGGDEPGGRDPAAYMLLCGSCNRSKSWSCEHCDNFRSLHDPNICRHCYWASPESYDHVAMVSIRRLDLTWIGSDEVKEFDSLEIGARRLGEPVGEFVKEVLRRHIEDNAD